MRIIRVLYLLATACAPLSAFAATIPVACTGSGTPLQAAVDAAQPGDVVAVTGNCVENVLVRNEKQRITIDGGGNATIGAASAAAPTLNVRGKGILIQNFANLEGASDVIHVNRGSNAVIHNNNTIQGAGPDHAGIRVDQFAFAIITGNTITANDVGILVDWNSSARIGFNAGPTIANTINFNNTGIHVEHQSNAHIKGNAIHGHTRDGVLVIRSSYATVESNDIFANSDFGVNVLFGSGASFSGNLSSVNNGIVGVRCSIGGYVEGNRFQLSGVQGGKSVNPTCHDSLS